MHRSQGKLLKSKLEMLNSLKETNEGHLNEDVKALQKEVNSMLDVENTKWQQRAKQNWLIEGDMNTIFFFISVLVKRGNTIQLRR